MRRVITKVVVVCVSLAHYCSMLHAGLGLTGVPVFNVNNNCSSGSTALMMAALMVQAGYDCTMAVGKQLIKQVV